MIKKRYPNLEIMNNFTLEELPDLNTCILGALELFQKEKLPNTKIPIKKRILVVGSGNALVTGRIIFEKYDAVFANESTYEQKLEDIDFKFAILLSASGGKHAPIIAKKLKSHKIETFLFTNNPEAKAKRFVSHTLVFPKQKEPYTYNTSTYLGMILSRTRENPKKIENYLKKIKKKIPKDFSNYDSMMIIVPREFDNVREMFHTKFDELFGPKLNGEIFTLEQMKHAKTIIPSKKQLFLGLGVKNNLYGEKRNRFNFKLPRGSGYGTLLSLGYYLIGEIQECKPPYFKQNIKKYTQQASKIFKEEINPIVE